MIEQQANALPFIAFFSAAKVGKTGLTVTVDVHRNGTEIVTAGAATEIGDGLYSYSLVSGSVNAEGYYTAVFKTTDSTVDAQHVPALWLVDKAGVERLDATVTSRASQASVDVVDDFLDTEIAAILAAVDTEVAAIKAKTDNLPASPAAVGSAMTLAADAITAAAIATDAGTELANALLDLSAGVETGLTVRQAFRLMAAALAGKISGAGTTTIVIRNAQADSKNRITATVDSDGNRSAITTDLT